MQRLRYDEPQRGDEIALVDAAGDKNGLFSRVRRVRSYDPNDPDRFEILDEQGRVLYVRRNLVRIDAWVQFYLERE